MQLYSHVSGARGDLADTVMAFTCHISTSTVCKYRWWFGTGFQFIAMPIRLQCFPLLCSALLRPPDRGHSISLYEHPTWLSRVYQLTTTWRESEDTVDKAYRVEVSELWKELLRDFKGAFARRATNVVTGEHLYPMGGSGVTVAAASNRETEMGHDV